MIFSLLSFILGSSDEGRVTKDEGRVNSPRHPTLDPSPSFPHPRHSILDTLFLPPSEPTATEAPGATCAGTEAIRPTTSPTTTEATAQITLATTKAAFRSAKPAGLALAEAVESVLALGARLLFSIGP